MKKLIGVILFIMLFCFAPTTLAAESLYAASVDGEVSMHISPSEASHKITTIPACSKINLLDKERTWGLVEFNNKCGWINMSYTRTSYSKAAMATGRDAARKVKVKSDEDAIPLYDVPSTDELLGSEVNYTVINDQILEVKRETPLGWGLVRINKKKYAWIQMEHTTPFQEQFDAAEYGAIEYVYVLSKDGKGLDLWDSTEKKNSLLVIPDCVRLTVREKKDGFAYVSHNGINGWIDYSCTTESLSNAQNSAGKALNVEYVVTPQSGEEARLLNIPSDNPVDGATEVGTIEQGASVFVQRTTVTGWCLINHNGELGWISSKDLVEAENRNVEITELLPIEREGYVATEGSEGIQVYGTCDGEYKVSVIPECVKVRVIAEKAGYEYVINDFTSGWIEKGNLLESYADAMGAYKFKNDLSYVAKKELRVMSYPTYSEKCESAELARIRKKTDFSVIKIVDTNDRSWGLTEFNGVVGWVDLGGAERTEATIGDIALIIGTILGIIILAFGVIFFLKNREKLKKENREKKKKIKKDKKTNNGNGDTRQEINEEKETGSNEEDISDADCQSCEKPADVSGK